MVLVGTTEDLSIKLTNQMFASLTLLPQTTIVVAIIVVLSISFLLVVKVLISRNRQISSLLSDCEKLEAKMDLIDFGSKTASFLSTHQFLLTNNEALSVILDGSSHAVFLKDEFGRFVFANKSFAKLYGAAPEKMVGKTISETGGSETEFNKFSPTNKNSRNFSKPPTTPAYIITKPDGSKFAMNAIYFSLKAIGVESQMVLAVGMGQGENQSSHIDQNNIPLLSSVADYFDGMVYRRKSDSNMTIEYISSSGKFLGYSRDELLGNRSRCFAEMIFEDDRQRVNRELHKSIAQSKKYSVEYRLKCCDGTIRWFKDSGRCTTHYSNADSILEGYLKDITNLKQLEQHNSSEKQRLHVLSEGTSSLIWEMDFGNNIISVSQKWAKLFPTRDEYFESTLDEMLGAVHEDDVEEFRKKLNRCRREVSDTMSHEFRHLSDDMRWKWIQVKARVAKHEKTGEPIKLLGIANDQTFQATNRQLLKRRLELISDNGELPENLKIEDVFDIEHLQQIQNYLANIVGIPLLITDVSGETVTESGLSRTMCSEMIRGTQEGLKQCSVTKLLTSCDMSEGIVYHRCPSLNFLEAGISIFIGGRHIGNWIVGQVIDEEFNEEVAIDFAQRSGINLDDLKHSLNGIAKMRSEKFAQFCNMIFLITKQLSMLAMNNVEQAKEIVARRETEKELAAKNKEMERIVDISSHDLRAPLVNIQGFACELENCCKHINDILHKQDFKNQDKIEIYEIMQGDAHEALEFINASANKMDMLQRGLLQISRLGRYDIEMKPINMDNLFSGILGSLEYQIREAAIKIDRPKYIKDCIGDEMRINQIFTNLIDNAIKYRRSDVRNTISISCEESDGNIIYKIEDNGIGISESEIEKVFDLFYRIEPRDQAGGEGLGLCLVKRIVERHGGKIWAESKHGEFTKFFIQLQKFDSAAQ